MLDRLISRYAASPIAYHEYDPRAPDVAQRVANMITSRLPTVTVEHIGSTAVLGCAGKGIVDLMVIYSEGQLETVKHVLDVLGFQRQTSGFIFPEDRPMRVGALEHDGTTFRLHVHVLAASSSEVATLRAFRERLRVDPKLLAAYVARKREIMASGVTEAADYTRLKSAFINETFERLLQ